MQLFVLSDRSLQRLVRAPRALTSLHLALVLALVLAFGGCGGGGDSGTGDTAGDTAAAGDGTGVDGLATDMAAPDTAADVAVGDATPVGPVVIVTEFIPNPCVVTDGDGEWIEVTNVSTAPVDINGWTLRDHSGDSHVIANVGPLVVEPGLSLVLGSNGDDTTNGGVTVDYVYRGFTMKNSGTDEIVLVDLAGEIVDQVAYDADWLTGAACAALQLSADHYTATDNDAAASWCAAVAPYGTGDNHGTPGGANALCVEDRCGDGTVDPDLGEECDLGSDNSNTLPDTCRESCKNPWCGDGVTDAGNDEACDDGAANSDTTADACRTSCALPSCGDGVTDPNHGEQCDDGPAGSDTCTTECHVVGEPPPTSPGDVFFTEIMRNSADSQDMGEWVELTNPGDTTFSLTGCVLRDDAGDSHTIAGPLPIAPAQHLVLARSADAVVTGGLVSDYVYSGFRLGNSTDQVILECFGTVIDEVRYSDAEAWPDLAAFSMALSAIRYGAVSNDDPANWCSARDDDAYGDGTNYGTPGAENPPCGDIDPTDWCRLQAPATVDTDAGVAVTIYGRVREAGVTDVTPGIDPPGRLLGRVGYGPDGSDPATDAGWTWLDAAPNPDWDGTAAGEIENDEYVATFPAPAPGTYDYAYRFSADAGATWTVCDLDGSDNGYDVTQAGAMTTAESACFPNPCTDAPAADCALDGVTVRTYSAPATCTPTGPDAHECSWSTASFDCSLTGATCQDGACLGGARVPAAGELVFTEIMRNPQGEDVGKEWVELRNTTADWLSLDQCTFSRSTASHMIVGAPVVAVRPGAVFVLAQGADTTTNGGVAVDYAYGTSLELGNTSDRVTLECGGAVIDGVVWDDALGWPDGTGKAMSLDPAAIDAVENDAVGNWCDASEPYGDGANLGSPGAANPPCAGDTEIDWCRFQWPLDQTAPAGTVFVAYGRVYDLGITDRTAGVDAFAGLIGAAGYGPDGSDPSVDDAGWVWFAATGNPAWDGAVAGEADNDEYVADVVTPSVGTYDLAYRFSLDDGVTWTYCDGGNAGSSDGYAAADAGALTATPSPCDTATCDTPDAPVCRDAANLVVSVLPGVCTVENDLAVCTYGTEIVDCTSTGGTCQAGACVGGARAPQPGEVIFTEVMYDTETPLSETTAEWFELTNLTADDLALNGCTVVDMAANTVTVGTLIVSAGDTALFVRTADTATNGGLTPDHVFGFGINNTDETLTLTCAAGVIDALAYDEGAGWPVAIRTSISLDPGAYDATANDDPDNWCVSATRYFAGAAAADEHFGTPDAVNETCPVPDTTVDWCRLQWPLDATVPAGTSLAVYGRVWDEGLTDQSTGNDLDPLLVGQAGYGPDGSDPSVDDTGWTWTDAAPTPAWDGAVEGEPNNDEYVASFAAPATGTYDHAFRFSLDGGLTWLVCDRDAGAGSDGSEDGYQAANAGSLVTEPSPCDPSPCDAATAAECDADGVTLVTYALPGVCTVDGGIAVCDYPATTRDCSLRGGTCAAGACVGEARPVAPGEVIITEIMFDTSAPLTENDAEWVELHNGTGDALALEGCVLSDAALNTTALATVLVPAGESVVLARTADPATNGGLTPAATFSFGLNNPGDDVVLTCGGVLIDAVTYNGDFPSAARFSIALDPGSYDATANGVGANWCLAAEADVYFAGAADAERHFGTPGAANPACPVIDTEVDWCRLQWPLDETVLAGTPFTVYGRVYEAGVTDQTTGVDVLADLVGQAGYGPDGSNPSADATGWTWIGAGGNPVWDAEAAGEPNNDEYLATFPAPSAGTFDFAYRFSRDGGTTWLYCDSGDAGTDDGYDPANAGNLVTEASPCDPNPCDTALADECDADGVTRITYSAPGACAVDAGNPVCTYPSTAFDCSSIGGTCEGGACVGGAQPPAEGDLVITEIMFDTSTPLAETAAEWIELYNASAGSLLLTGCTIIDGSAATPRPLDGLIVAPDAFVLLARSNDPAVNGGLAPATTFSFGLNNDGDTVTVACGGTTIDTVDYGAVAFPAAARFSIALDPDFHDATANDNGLNWCLAAAADVYFAGAAEAEQHYGTPGAPNPDCPTLDLAVDWCRYQWPLDETIVEGGALDLYGRMYNAGLTDATTGIDGASGLVAQGGYGPDGSDPSVDDTGWTWADAAGTPAWDGGTAGEPDNDEYAATVDAVAAGTWDLAFRFSLDYGQTWLYCDQDAGAGSDGSEDGYQAANAGSLSAEDSPCVPNPCVAPPAATCDADGVTRITPVSPGVCTDIGGAPDCDYGATETFDCSTMGALCLAGVCEGGAATATPGDLVISEILYDVEAPLLDANAEWFEVVNVSGQPVSLGGCVVEDAGGTATTITALTVASGAYALFVRSDVALDNGRLVPDYLFDAGLNNGAETLTIRCGADVIDEVAYDDGLEFPNGQRIAIALDPAQMDATANDDGANWCLARARYFASTPPGDAPPPLAAGDHYGTPGAPNAPCDSVVDWCRYQHPLALADVAAGTPTTLYGRVHEAGLTDLTGATDAIPALWASAGVGPAGSDPSVDDTGWVWTPAVANSGWDGPAVDEADNDEYEATIPAPAPGAYALAYRMSLDGGRSWRFCDGGEAGSSDGFDPANQGSLTTIAGTIEPLFFSEYVEGSSNNKALEIYNAGAGPVLLSSCEVRVYPNGATAPNASLSLAAVELAAGDVWVVCHPSFDPLLNPGDFCDETLSLGYNGDDAVALNCQGTMMDIIGQIGVDPGAEWLGSTSVPAIGTQNDTLVRNCSVTEGDANGDDAFDPDAEWTSAGLDGVAGLGVHCP